VPVKRIPKTTSGKLQRHLLAHSYLEGEFDTQLAELEQLRASKPAAGITASGLAQKLKQICDSALADRRIGLNDNLFEIGVSSLKLIEIHENIDREFPGLVDLTELFDYPTVAELAEHLEKKVREA
jgi:acyl carrier protein